MNIKTFKKYRKEINAFCDGQIIECFTKSGEWVRVEFDFLMCLTKNFSQELRIVKKPEYQYSNMTIEGVKKTYPSQSEALIKCNKFKIENCGYLYIASRSLKK